MKLQTHIAFGLFFGMLFYYLLGFGLGFVLLTGFAAFVPDIDWAMQFKWHMGKRHRTFGHNIWFMIIIAVIVYLMSGSLLLMFGIIVGFLSHLIADSFTVTGVYWLYPYGKNEKKFWKNGPLNMSNFEREYRIEKIIQVILLMIAGFLFVSKSMSIDVFSLEGIVSLGVIVVVGYVLMQSFNRMIVKAIRSWKI